MASRSERARYVRPVRAPRHPFDPGLVALPGTRPNEESWKLAQRLSVAIGEPDLGNIELYLEALSAAPAQDLARLERVGAVILMAPTVPVGLTHTYANSRRGRTLDWDEHQALEHDYGQAS